MRTGLLLLCSVGCVASGPSAGPFSPTMPPAAAPMPPAAAPMAEPAQRAAADGCAAPDVANERDAAVDIVDRIDGCFEPGGGLDWYRYTVPGDRLTRVWIDVVGAPGSLSTFLYVENAAAKRLGTAMVLPRETERLELIAEPGAVVFFKTYANSDPTPRWPWSATFRTEPADVDEPNDSPQTATPLTLGESRVGALTPRLQRDGELVGDGGDFYVVDVKTPGRLRVAIDEVGNTISPELEITTSAGKRVRGPHPPGVSKPVEMTLAVAAGLHTISLRHGNFPGTRPLSAHQKENERAPIAPRYRITATLEPL